MSEKSSCPLPEAGCRAPAQRYDVCMDSGRIKELVSDLHKELDRLPEADEGLKAGLRTLARDTERLVDQEPDATPAGQLGDEIREMTADFEARYPRVSLILSDLVDALGKLGI